MPELLCTLIGVLGGAVGGMIVVIFLPPSGTTPPGRAVKLDIHAGTPTEQSKKRE